MTYILICNWCKYFYIVITRGVDVFIFRTMRTKPRLFIVQKNVINFVFVKCLISILQTTKSFNYFLICGDQNEYVCIFVCKWNPLLIQCLLLIDMSLSHYHCYHITGIWCYYIDLLERYLFVLRRHYNEIENKTYEKWQIYSHLIKMH